MRHAPRMVAVLLLLGGCASAPDIQYYTFTMGPSGETRSGVDVAVEEIRTTEALGRRRILIQATPTRVEYYATAEWAGGLGELVTEKLRSELGPPREGRPTVALRGTLLACGQVDTPEGARARARIRVRFRDQSRLRFEPPLLERTYEAERPAADGSPGSVAEALSTCLEEIAREIAMDAERLPVASAEPKPAPRREGDSG